MTDLDFERKVNPWLFDANGKLTDAAKKEHPDLAAAESGTAAPGWTPPSTHTTGGGGTVKVSPDALRKASGNATTLNTAFGKACKDAWKDQPSATQGMAKDWKVVGALATAQEVWAAQAQATGGLLGRISNALSVNAEQYARADQQNANNFPTP
ncbi:WXG100 family type VII secretion target [Kitasatospora sp. NPDC101183]|uniref:WXG100 family type VII secretion target n=1 Tax=Kitasatospora sp. NPDC101183 TaxID=3364100 RepID=UPI0038250909